MIKNNKIKTCIIGACIIANTMGMTAFADTNADNYRTLPANEAYDKAEVLQMGADTAVSSDDALLYTTQILQVENDDAIIQKQAEIDRYLFEDHREELSQKGFTVTHTVPVGSQIEIGIKPYNQANADYLYEIFGKDAVMVVAGEQPEIMQVALGAPEKSAEANGSKIISFFDNLWAWIKNIF